MKTGLEGPSTEFKADFANDPSCAIEHVRLRCLRTSASFVGAWVAEIGCYGPQLLPLREICLFCCPLGNTLKEFDNQGMEVMPLSFEVLG